MVSTSRLPRNPGPRTPPIARRCSSTKLKRTSPPTMSCSTFPPRAPAPPRPGSSRRRLMRIELAALTCVFVSGLSYVFAADAAAGAGATVIDSGTISGLGARNIGSAAMSGRISALAGYTDPSGKVTLFVGAASGGVWKSTDGGTTFKPVFDEQPVQSIGAIALDPSNPKNVWVGSGEAWTRNSVSIGDGIYKSTDAGTTWQLVLKGSNLSTGCGSIALDPRAPDVLFASLWDFRRKGWTFRSGGDGPSASSASGLYRSADGGKSWTEITPQANKGLPPKPY